MSKREQLRKAREALKSIRKMVDADLEGDSNPHRGMLMAISRKATQGLEESK